jgi:hypothetical protein
VNPRERQPEPDDNAGRLDWSRRFDLDGDAAYDDVLDPGARATHAGDLSIDYPSSLQLRVRGSLTAPAATHTIRSS